MFEESKKGAGGDNVAAMGQLVEALRKSMQTLGRVVVDVGDEAESMREGA